MYRRSSICRQVVARGAQRHALGTKPAQTRALFLSTVAAKENGRRTAVRKALFIIAFAAALSLCGAATAAVGPPVPSVICGGACDGGGGGWSGCTQQTESNSASIPLI